MNRPHIINVWLEDLGEDYLVLEQYIDSVEVENAQLRDTNIFLNSKLSECIKSLDKMHSMREALESISRLNDHNFNLMMRLK